MPLCAGQEKCRPAYGSHPGWLAQLFELELESSDCLLLSRTRYQKGLESSTCPSTVDSVSGDKNRQSSTCRDAHPANNSITSTDLFFAQKQYPLQD